MFPKIGNDQQPSSTNSAPSNPAYVGLKRQRAYSHAAEEAYYEHQNQYQGQEQLQPKQERTPHAHLASPETIYSYDMIMSTLVAENDNNNNLNLLSSSPPSSSWTSMSVPQSPYLPPPPQSLPSHPPHPLEQVGQAVRAEQQIPLAPSGRRGYQRRHAIVGSVQVLLEDDERNHLLSSLQVATETDPASTSYPSLSNFCPIPRNKLADHDTNTMMASMVENNRPNKLRRVSSEAFDPVRKN